MSEFTKGPWHVGEKRGEFVDINHSDDTPGAISGTLAKITARLTWLDEAKANAHLITASPDMYEALLAYDTACVLDEQYRAAILTKKALAKANGEQ